MNLLQKFLLPYFGNRCCLVFPNLPNHVVCIGGKLVEQNPSFQLIIINYRDTGIIESDIFYKEAGERGNIMMVNETFKEFVDAYPNIKIYDQSDEYRLVKIVNEGN